jgi:hypothetical protein
MAVAPGLTHWIPLPYGSFREFLRDPIGFQVRARERFGDVFRFRIGPLLVHFLYHPDHVRWARAVGSARRGRGSQAASRAGRVREEQSGMKNR